LRKKEEAAKFLINSDVVSNMVKDLQLSTSLELKPPTCLMPLDAKYLFNISKVETNQIDMHIKKGVTLNITPGIIHKLLGVPCGNTPNLKQHKLSWKGAYQVETRVAV
jgi:hypothetical protein